MEASRAISYGNFMRFAVSEAELHTKLTSLPSHDRFRSIGVRDKKTVIHTLSYEAPKVRLFRSFSVDGGCKMQVLDFTVFPKPEFDLPLFCANFYANPHLSIVVLDLNPLHDVIVHKSYKDKYYKNILHLGKKYLQVFPWGDKLTAESLKFFSPIVIWTKFTPNDHMHEMLYNAFVDYFKTWLDLMDKAEEEHDPERVIQNRRAQHRYLTWRAEKDPGRPLLQKLLEEGLAEDIVRNFLFDGVDYLGSESFLDYFPDYRCDDGTINSRRSIIGKSFESRPWDERGELICG